MRVLFAITFACLVALFPNSDALSQANSPFIFGGGNAALNLQRGIAAKEGTDLSTPPSGTRFMYSKSDGWYEKDSSGTVRKFSGDVSGPASSTNDALARFNGTTGKTLKSGGLIVNADVSGAAAIAYSKLALTGSIVNADVNGSAAIAYSKLALSGSIVDGDINGATTITGSKLQAASASNAGAVNTTTQSFAGNKTFQGSNTDFGTSTTANPAVRLIGNSGTLEYRYVEGSSTKWSMLHNVSNARWELYDYVGGAVRFSVTQGGVPRFLNLPTGSATNAVHYDTTTKELYYVSSSRRYKDKIRPLQIDSSKVLQLEPRTFTDRRSGKETIGLIAEEVAETLPSLVGTIEVDAKGDRIDWNDGKRRQGPKPTGTAIPDTVYYDRIPVLLLPEVKKLRADVDALRAEVAALRAEMNDLKGLRK